MVVLVEVVVELQEGVKLALVVVAILEVVFGSAWRACLGTRSRSLAFDSLPLWVASPTFRVARCLLRRSRWCGRGATVAWHLRVAFALPSIACLFDRHACIRRIVHAHVDVSIVADPRVSVLLVHTHARPPFSFHFHSVSHTIPSLLRTGLLPSTPMLRRRTWWWSDVVWMRHRTRDKARMRRIDASRRSHRRCIPTGSIRVRLEIVSRSTEVHVPFETEDEPVGRKEPTHDEERTNENQVLQGRKVGDAGNEQEGVWQAALRRVVKMQEGNVRAPCHDGNEVMWKRGKEGREETRDGTERRENGTQLKPKGSPLHFSPARTPLFDIGICRQRHTPKACGNSKEM